MAAPWPTATIVRGETRTDAAVPPGTTVAGLLAMSEVDTSDVGVSITLPDGSPADLGAIIGGDVPSGVLLAVTDATATRDAAERAGHEDPSDWLVHGPGEFAALLLSSALGMVAVLPLLLGLPTLDDSLRWGAAALGILLAIPLTRTRHARTPGFALLVPALIGFPLASLVPLSLPFVRPLTLVTGLVVTAVVAFLLHLVQRDSVRLASASAWAGGAGLVTVAILLDRSAHETAVLILAAAVVLIRLAPARSLPVPETQLLDLPLLMTSAPTVRSAPVTEPSRITGRRVNRTVTWAGGATATLFGAGFTAAAAAGLFFDLEPTLEPSGFKGWGTLILFVCAILALSLIPRSDASATGRWLPRLAAVTLVGVWVWRVIGADIGSPALFATLIVGAGLIPLLSVALTREPRSALLGHMADIIQGWSLALLLPAAFAASGFFDLFREVLS